MTLSFSRAFGHWGMAPLFLVLLAPSECSPPRPQTTPVPPPNPEVSFPKIAPASSKTALTPFKHTFTFEGSKYEISLKIDSAALQGARSTEKVIKMTRVIPQLEQDAGLRWALISDPAQDGFFADLIDALRKIKTKNGLDTDRYAELISVFAQSVEYCTTEDMPPKFPIETVADGCGDCDDKSLLAAGVLFRENYDVALFSFHKEKHMAVGIRSTDAGFLNSGYVYIETTAPSYIGFPSNEYSEVKITSKPDIVVLGEKPNIWSKSAEVTFLHDTLKQKRTEAESIAKELEQMKQENQSMKDEYQTLLADLKQSKGRVPVAAYNKKVDETNGMGAKLNHAVDKYNELVQAHNRSMSIAAYIFDHPDNRYGVYRWVKAQKN